MIKDRKENLLLSIVVLFLGVGIMLIGTSYELTSVIKAGSAIALFSLVFFMINLISK